MINSSRRALSGDPTEQPRAGVELLETRLMLTWSGGGGSHTPGSNGNIFCIPDPCHPDDPTKQAIVVMGTNGNDNIQINQVGTSNRFTIKINGREMGNWDGSDGSHGGSGSGSNRHNGRDGGSDGSGSRGRNCGSRGSRGSRGGSGSHGGSGSDGNGGHIVCTGDIERVIVYGCGGNDEIKVSGGTRVSTWLFGGSGNDKLRGGKGGDVIDGGLGDDTIAGYDGRDMLIGGKGKDNVAGDKHDDIVIAGYTAYDGTGCPVTKDQAGALLGGGENRQAYCKIMDEWTRTDLTGTALEQYNQRVFHLFTPDSAGTGGLNEPYYLNADDPFVVSTVYDDGVKDCLAGNQGLDWFFFNADPTIDPGADGIEGTSDDMGTRGDVITDLNANEFAQDIDFITSG